MLHPYRQPRVQGGFESRLGTAEGLECGLAVGIESELHPGDPDAVRGR